MKNVLIPILALSLAFTFSCASEVGNTGLETDIGNNTKSVVNVPDAKIPDVKTPEISSERVVNTKIDFKELAFDFGEVSQNKPVRHTFTFTNTGNEDLVLENVKASCNCTTPSWTKEPVKPGDTGEITAEYNAKSNGVFNKSVTITSNGSEAPIILKIKGEVAGTEGK